VSLSTFRLRESESGCAVAGHDILGACPVVPLPDGDSDDAFCPTCNFVIDPSCIAMPRKAVQVEKRGGYPGGYDMILA
jgi:hypothetical protein